MSGNKTVIQIDREFLHALVGVINSGAGLERLRKTSVYKQALDAMEAEGTRTHEQYLMLLDEVCNGVIKRARRES
jgi:hypothetical protein